MVTEAPGTNNEWASYDSIYRILADAIEQDPSFGVDNNLEVFGEDLAPSESFVRGLWLWPFHPSYRTKQLETSSEVPLGRRGPKNT